jgi:hypothetical protein
MGLRSASSSSEHWRSSLSSEEEEVEACTAPLGDNGSMGRGRVLCEDGVFLLVTSVGRGRGRCARMVFFVGCKSGERKRALGERGMVIDRGTHSAIIEKTAPEKIRVVVGSVQFKLIQF